jgi:hypothetical protein
VSVLEAQDVLHQVAFPQVAGAAQSPFVVQGSPTRPPDPASADTAQYEVLAVA